MLDGARQGGVVSVPVFPRSTRTNTKTDPLPRWVGLVIVTLTERRIVDAPPPRQVQCLLRSLPDPLGHLVSIAWLNACWSVKVGQSTTQTAAGAALAGAPARKAVLMVLADHADEDGFCWPSARTIESKTELSETVVRRAIRTLEEDDWIEVREDYEPAGRQTSNVYRLLVNEKYPPVSTPGGRVSPRQGEGVTTPGSTGTTIRTPRRKQVPTKPAAAGFAHRSPDESLTSHDDEAPAMGVGEYDGPAERRAAEEPKKKKPKKRQPHGEAEAERIAKYERAAASGKTAFGQASRLFLGLRDKGHPGAVNVPAVSKQMASWLAEDGIGLSLVAAMVDAFVASPARYGASDEIPWRSFINARQKLVTDAGKIVKATTPTKRVSRYAHLED